jgi:hypothetical protein
VALWQIIFGSGLSGLGVLRLGIVIHLFLKEAKTLWPTYQNGLKKYIFLIGCCLLNLNPSICLSLKHLHNNISASVDIPLPLIPSHKGEGGNLPTHFEKETILCLSWQFTVPSAIFPKK